MPFGGAGLRGRGIRGGLLHQQHGDGVPQRLLGGGGADEHALLCRGPDVQVHVPLQKQGAQPQKLSQNQVDGLVAAGKGQGAPLLWASLHPEHPHSQLFEPFFKPVKK